MIYLKIIAQLLTGISGLVALLLDYKWHDKRKKIFKTLRNFLIFLTIVSLIAGVIITINDEKDKTDEITNLTNKLDTTQNTLTYIKSNGDTLKSQIKPFLDLATQQYPNLSSSQALEKLKNRLNDLDKQVLSGSEKITNLSSQLTTEKKTIKTFDVSVYIEFSGKWKGQPYPSWYQPTSPRTFLKWTDKTKKLPDIEFSSPKINFKTINGNTAVFENTLSVQPGITPLGQLDDILSSYNQMSFWFLFTEPENLLDSRIVVNKVKIVFLINGSINGELNSDNKTEIVLAKAGANQQLNPMLTLDGNLVDLLKMKL